MVKFFRVFRRNLLSQNRFNKYLIYAIGEIVLVVIGILIALQINNWNNQRIESKLESNILNEIMVNLEKDVINLHAKIKYNENKITANSSVLDHLLQKTSITDSLKTSYTNLIGRGAFQPITVAYENLKAKGIDILQNDSVRIAISELYDFKYFYLTEDLMADYMIIRELHENVVYKNIKSYWDGQNYWSEPFNLQELQNNIYFQEILNRALGFYRYMNIVYSRGIKENKEVQEKIRKELQ